MGNRIFDKIATLTRMGFLGAFLLLLISYVLTHISTQRVIEQTQGITHTNRIIQGLENIQGFVTKAESSFRGYLLSDNAELLVGYKESVNNIDSTLNLLKQLTQDNSIHQQNLQQLNKLIDQKISSIDEMLNQYSKNHAANLEYFRNQLAIGKEKEIQQKVIEMQGTERDLYKNRAAVYTRYSGFIKFFNIVSFVIAMLLTVYSLIVFNKENKAKKQQEEKTVDFRQQLEKRIEQLADLNKELIELRSLEKYSVTGRIARVIAHEVRNPLTNINLSIEQLRMEKMDSESAVLFFDMIARNSDRINQLVSDLLNSSRTAELNIEKLGINEVLDDSLALAKDRIELKQIKVVKNYDLEICSISIDKEKIKIAFLNIIVNAIEAMGENGTLTLSSENLNNRCVVKISDNGKGMSKGDVSRLFEPYFTTKEKGNGLGLANSQNIIIGHGGSISGESELEYGTTFTISFNFA